MESVYDMLAHFDLHGFQFYGDPLIFLMTYLSSGAFLF